MEKELLELIEKSIAGDEVAFAALCRVKAKDILYISIRMMGNVQDGEDAAQEIMIYMRNHIADLKEPRAFHVWIYRVTRSICSNMRRKVKGKMKKLEEDEGMEVAEDRTEFLPDAFMEDETKKEKLMKIIYELPDKCRICVLLFYYEEMSYKKIAVVMNITPKDVDNILMRSKRIIRRKLEKDEEMKKLLKQTFGIVPVPLLSRILQEDAKQVLSESAIDRVANAGISGAGGAEAGSSSLLTIGKVSAGIVAGTAIIGTAVYLNNLPKDGEQEEPAVMLETEDEVVQTAVEEEPEKPIRTLGDMIGEREAVVMTQYAAEGAEQEQEVFAFLGEIEMESQETIYIENEEQYAFYCLYKQDKLLMVIVYTRTGEAGCSLVYRFTTKEEQLPRSMEMTLFFDEWK